ncbi:hypothetical protein CDD81_4558 [Ophiocordyceps australis]|uniref:Glucosidase 2 subunit beta n=1 Tax=Ophiocordyceps australis TaxID=1399860 RepID=A0A2C5YA35_9HYPO|nr:hypothetical protein CDD81_4558 [Ophiocordyceps australis]
MPHSHRLVLLGAFCSLSAAGLPRGVGPQFASHYTPDKPFSCISHPELTIAFDRVNDNTCDCPDGSDEPGTAACAFIDALSPAQPRPGSSSGSTNATNPLPGFWCANEGHIASYVPFSHVNDGICDYDTCCDGSEEFAGIGGVSCENRCAQIGKDYQGRQKELKQSFQRAQQKRLDLQRVASELRRQAQSLLVELEGEVTALEAEKANLEQKLSETEIEDRNRVVKPEGTKGGKLSVLAGLARARVDELRSTLGTVVDERNDLRSRLDELTAVLGSLKDEYNPNFNDEGVKAAIKAFEDYAARQQGDASQVPDSEVDRILQQDDASNGVDWASFEEEQDDTDVLYKLEAYLPAAVRSMLRGRLDSLRLFLIKNGILADTAKSGTESVLVKSAREAVETADRNLQDKTRARDAQRDDLGRDYGPDDIFRALKGRSISTDAGEYSYELVWLERTSQVSKKGAGGGGATNMGNFARIERQMADEEERSDGRSLGVGERYVLYFENGLGCWNGPQRSTHVWLACAEVEQVWRVTEAEKCVYKMEVGTPAVCESPGTAATAQQQAKDEL